MKIALFSFLLFGVLASSANAASQYSCETGFNKVVFSLADQTILSFNSSGEPKSGVFPEPIWSREYGSAYSFYFYDYADTNYWIDVTVAGGKVISATEFSSSNDSDGYVAKPTMSKVTCAQL